MGVDDWQDLRDMREWGEECYRMEKLRDRWAKEKEDRKKKKKK